MLARQPRNNTITVTPPTGRDAVANMLVALGNARIGVSMADPMVDGAYLLTVDGDPRVAADVLARIGCRASIDD